MLTIYNLSQPVTLQKIDESARQKLGEKIQVKAGEQIRCDTSQFGRPTQTVTVVYNEEKYIGDRLQLMKAINPDAL